MWKYAILVLPLFINHLASQKIDVEALKYSIAMMESSNGKNIGPRFEPGFLRRYGNKGIMPKLRRLFGDEAASSSYGKYQIMLCVSWENGFQFTPEDLAKEDNNEIVFMIIINKYIRKYGNNNGSLPFIYKAYNGGGNENYTKRAINIYWQRYGVM